ncbi:hypothetical protein KY285_035449 [Solanum tuberosum]|nr:hypothetical protein KY285_035449 [Solanum tuberosum]
MEYALELRRTTSGSQIKGSNSSPQSLFHEERGHYMGISQENKGISSQFEIFLSVVLAEEVQGDSVLSLRDDVVEVVQDNMVGEVEDDNFNDPDYNLEEGDEDYHDVVTECRHMKVKGRPKKNIDSRMIGVGPSTTGILIPQVNQNAESDYDDSDELLEGVLIQKTRIDPTWSVKGIIAIVQKDLGYTIEYMKAWRAKRQALKWVYGDEGAQYEKLLRYRADLLNTNPGSNVEIWRDDSKFKGFYVCLASLKEAFKSGCRPLISLDGCWLKGTYGGNLLAVVAIDPNDCIFPVAYVVIADAESKETWSWFLTNLGYDLEITNSHHIAFMSDRQMGLIGAVKDLFPEAEHRNCVRHMYQNFRQKHKGKALKDLVWNAARASNEVRFRICMERLEQEDREARKWFDHSERPFQTWTRALFKTHSRCDMLLNNLCESFNRYILDARDKAIITLLEMIKNKLMKRLCKKKEWINKYQGLICPKIEKKLNQIRLEATLFRPNFSGGPKVSVEGPGGPFIVDIQKGSCTCRRWDLTGLPCPHALVSIHGIGDRVEDYVNVYYKVETFKNLYSHFINPTNPEDHWPEVMNGGEVLPPKIVRKKRGRKPKLRQKEAEELQKQKQAEAQRQLEKTRQPFETQDLVSETADCVRGDRCAQDETADCVRRDRCAQDESVDCVRGARRAQDESANYVRGDQCAQDEKTDASKKTAEEEITDKEKVKGSTNNNTQNTRDHLQKGRGNGEEEFQEQRRKYGNRRGGQHQRREQVWNPRSTQNKENEVITINMFGALGEEKTVEDEIKEADLTNKAQVDNIQSTPSKEDIESNKLEPSNAKEQGHINEEPEHSHEVNTPYRIVVGTKDTEYTEGQHSSGSNSSKTMIPSTRVDKVELAGKADPAAVIDADKVDSSKYEGEKEKGATQEEERGEEEIRVTPYRDTKIHSITKEERAKKQQEEEDDNMEGIIEEVSRKGDLSPMQTGHLRGKTKKGTKSSTIPIQVNTRTFERLQDLNRRNHYSYIALLEPFQSPAELDNYKRRLGMQYAKANCSGKIWCFWNECWEEEGSTDTIQQLTINYKLKGSHDRFKVTAVYARCGALDRLKLWDTLEDATMNTAIPWMVGGDFNTIVDESEKLGGLPVTQNEISDFAQCICACALTELNFTGSCYTWWNGRIEEASIFKRLDRVFGNNEFFSLLPNSETHHLIRQGSDHAPLHVICNTIQDQASKLFRFLNFWTKHKDFSGLVEEVWCENVTGSPFSIVQTKLKRLKAVLSKWSRTTFGNIFQQIATLEDVVRVNETQLEISPTEVNKAILSKSNAELKRYLKIEEEYWKQKAGMKWFRDGDRNTRFLHSYVKGKRRKLHLSEIQTRQGDWITTSQNIGEEAVDVFKDQFQETQETTDYSMLQSIPRLITDEQNVEMERLPEKNEVKKVVFLS